MSDRTIEPGDRLIIQMSVPVQEVDKYPAKKHAQNVAAKLGAKKGLIYLPGQKTTSMPDSDLDSPFRQLRYFYYLSGVDVPDCFLTYEIAKDCLTLYTTVVPPLKAIWFGPGLSLQEAESQYDVDIVKSAEDLEYDLTAWIGANAGSSVFLLHDSQKPELDRAIAADPFNSGPLQHAMDTCRVIKDEHELNLLQKANDISAIAHTEVLRNLRHFKNEREVDAIFNESCRARGITSQSYDVIAGSGPNAAILHYMKNNEPLKGRQLLLLDAGCDWHCYASDVTRTFPISGDWPSKESKQIYDLVDAMQTGVIEQLKPGVRYRDMGSLAVEIMVKGLQKIGILKPGPVGKVVESGAARIFFPHGLGHHVGLEVHDVSPEPITGLGREELKAYEVEFKSVPSPHISDAVLLEENMLITVEPGIYFSIIAFERLVTKEMLEYIDLDLARNYLPVGGVRIEDDVLITRDGHKVFTTAPRGEEACRIIRGEA